MVFKIQTLESTVLLVRGYKCQDDIKYCFVCTFHREIGEKGWNVHGALSTVGTRKEADEVFTFLEEFPEGTYTMVSEKDFKRFYKKHYFTCIDFSKNKREINE